MRLLIKIMNLSPQICEEAVTLAFAMVAFEHEVQLWLTADCQVHLLKTDSKLAKMLTSLDLYEMPPAWYSPTDDGIMDLLHQHLIHTPELAKQLIALPETVKLNEFDSVLTF